MLSVYGVAPSSIVLSGSVLVEFPPLSDREVGGVVPVDCKVSVLNLAHQALNDIAYWPWKPAGRGYVISTRTQSPSLLKNHLRQIRHIQDSTGSNQIWPWFDPRYLRLALETLEGPELEKLFGPIESFGFSVDSQMELIQLKAGSIQVLQVPA